MKANGTIELAEQGNKYLWEPINRTPRNFMAITWWILLKTNSHATTWLFISSPSRVKSLPRDFYSRPL